MLMDRHRINLPFLHFILLVYPLLQDHPFLESHTMQVHKPLFYFQSTHLTEVPDEWPVERESYAVQILPDGRIRNRNCVTI